MDGVGLQSKFCCEKAASLGEIVLTAFWKMATSNIHVSLCDDDKDVW